MYRQKTKLSKIHGRRKKWPLRQTRGQSVGQEITVHDAVCSQTGRQGHRPTPVPPRPKQPPWARCRTASGPIGQETSARPACTPLQPTNCALLEHLRPGTIDFPSLGAPFSCRVCWVGPHARRQAKRAATRFCFPVLSGAAQPCEPCSPTEGAPNRPLEIGPLSSKAGLGALKRSRQVQLWAGHDKE